MEEGSLPESPPVTGKRISLWDYWEGAIGKRQSAPRRRTLRILLLERGRICQNTGCVHPVNRTLSKTVLLFFTPVLGRRYKLTLSF